MEYHSHIVAVYDYSMDNSNIPELRMTAHLY